VNFAPSCRRAASPTRSSPLGAAARLCVRTALGCSEFLLVGRLPSIASSWFGDFSGTTHPSDFSQSFISAFRPWPSLRGSSDSPSTSDREISRFPREKFSLACPALRPRRFLPELAFSLWSAWPSALSPDGVGNRNFGVFSRLNHAACTTPCQRLVLHLAASTHDSGPSWFATPFLVLSRYFSPVSRRSRRDAGGPGVLRHPPMASASPKRQQPLPTTCSTCAGSVGLSRWSSKPAAKALSRSDGWP
jgi:hypothetical protein